LLVGAIGIAAAYPEVKLASRLTPAAFADIARVKSECVDATVKRWSGSKSTAIFTSDPVKSPILRRIFDENSPGAADPKVPMLIAHGGNDEQIPVDISATLAAKYCRLGASVTRRTYPDIDHEGVVDAAGKDIISWMTARLEGQAATSTCA
jgi:dienelactone hydrolase